MPIASVAQIDRWSPAALRVVADAARTRANTAQNATETLGALPAFTTWQGSVREKAHQSIETTRTTLGDHDRRARAVAQAVETAAGQIEHIKTCIDQIRQSAAGLGLIVDPMANTVRPAHAGRLLPHVALAALTLQARLAEAISQANVVDGTLAQSLASDIRGQEAVKLAGLSVPTGVPGQWDPWDDWYDKEEDLPVITPTGPTGASGGAGYGTAPVSNHGEVSGGRIIAVSDGWDEPAEPWKIGGDMEEDDFGFFHPVHPVNPGGGATGGGSGTAPI